MVTLPESAQDEVASVVRLELDGAPQVGGLQRIGVFRTVSLGKMKLNAGPQSFQIGGPEKGKGPGINLERVVLTPAS